MYNIDNYIKIEFLNYKNKKKIFKINNNNNKLKFQKITRIII